MPNDVAVSSERSAEVAAQIILPYDKMPMALALYLNPVLYERAQRIAGIMCRAEGFTPKHLLGKGEACFAVVTRALTWRLDPFAVACSTYQTPGGRIGYEGKLCQAILENSGQVVGGVKFEHIGDWKKLIGKFRIGKSDKGYDIPIRTWDQKDAEGLGVVVRAQLHGEDAPREWDFWLVQAFPLNSTLWATDPKTQICYTAVRRFASAAAPGVFMGVPFDREDEIVLPGDSAVDVTPPRPRREDFAESAADREFREAQEEGRTSDVAVETLNEETESESADAREGAASPPAHASADGHSRDAAASTSDGAAGPAAPTTTESPAPAGSAAGERAAAASTSTAPGQGTRPDEFWGRESYEIAPPTRGKDKTPDWTAWINLITPRIERAPNTDCLMKLDLDNGSHFEGLKGRHGSAYDAIRRKITARYEQLGG